MLWCTLLAHMDSETHPHNQDTEQLSLPRAYYLVIVSHTCAFKIVLFLNDFIFIVIKIQHRERGFESRKILYYKSFLFVYNTL